MPSEDAHLGNSSSGGGNASSAEVNLAIEQASKAAQLRGYAAPTLELILLALLDRISVQEILAAHDADTKSLRAALVSHIDANIPPAPANSLLDVETDLQRVLSRAAMKSYLNSRKHITEADILEAILVEQTSFAAKTLRDHGLTLKTVESQIVEKYLVEQQEEASRLNQLLKKMEEHKASAGKTQDSDSARIEKYSGQAKNKDAGIKSYLLRVTSNKPANFKAAISCDGHLDLYIEETPFEAEFLAERLAALFDTIAGGVRLRVELITDIDGQPHVTAAFEGQCGAIFEDPSEFNYQRSGRL